MYKNPLPKNEMPKISVWLTSYNHGEELRESIESVLNQTYQDFELVIVDDYSTDNSRDIIDEYARNNPKIRKIYHERNIGGSGLPNALDSLRGEYVAILNGDDKWEYSKLEKQVQILEEHEEIAACFTGVQVIDEDGRKYTDSSYYEQVFKVKQRTRYEWLRYFFYKGNCLCHSSLLIRKYAYKKYKLLEGAVELGSFPDFSEWIKLCLASEIYVIEDRLTMFRKHKSELSQSSDTESKQNRLFYELNIVYQNYFQINDMETLVKVFPESEKYIKNGECVVGFALAKIFIEAPWKAQKILGLNSMYNLLQDKEVKLKINKLYGYGKKEFELDKQKYDIFGMLSREKYIFTTLYFDTGAGYGEAECIKKKIFVPGSGIVRVSYNLGEKIAGKQIKGIRFDPDEEILRKCKVIDARWEGDDRKVMLKARNGIAKDGWDFFFTLDPQYEIMSIRNGVLNLSLKIKPILTNELENYLSNLEKELEGYRSTKLAVFLYKTKKRIKRQIKLVIKR